MINYKTHLISLLFISLSIQMTAQQPVERLQAITNWIDTYQTELYRIWQQPLGKHLVYADRETGEAYSTWQVDASYDRVFGSMYHGLLDDSIIIANTNIVLNGVPAAMVALPVADELEDALLLVLHESFHVVQDSIYETKGYSNSHLDDLAARTLLKTECHYLVEAIGCLPSQRDSLVSRALAYRLRRMEAYGAFVDDEAAFELAEGLAEYTAVKAVYHTTAQRAAYVRDKGETLRQATTIHRSFGYLSGMAYALLLDDYVPGWRPLIHGDSNLALLLKEAVWPGDSLSVEAAVDSVFIHCQAQELLHQQRQELFNDSVKTVFANAPLYVFPLSAKRELGFSPNHLFNIPDFGLFFPFMVLTDEWGQIAVRLGGGVVLADDNTVARVLMVDEYTSIQLHDGWEWQTVPLGKQLVKSNTTD